MSNTNNMGGHLIIDITDCVTTGKLDEVIDKMSSLATELNLNVVSACSHQFEPQGATHILLLSESHFSIHTFPETERITIDLYCCKDLDWTKAVYAIGNKFKGKLYARLISRDDTFPSPPRPDEETQTHSDV